MVSFFMGLYKHVVYVYLKDISFLILKHYNHQTLVDGVGVLKAEWHNIKLNVLYLDDS